MSPVTYRPCPKCGKYATDAAISIQHKRGLVIFDCPHCGTLYSTITARNGLLLEVRGG